MLTLKLDNEEGKIRIEASGEIDGLPIDAKAWESAIQIITEGVPFSARSVAGRLWATMIERRRRETIRLIEAALHAVLQQAAARGHGATLSVEATMLESGDLQLDAKGL